MTNVNLVNDVIAAASNGDILSSMTEEQIKTNMLLLMGLKIPVNDIIDRITSISDDYQFALLAGAKDVDIGKLFAKLTPELVTFRFRDLLKYGIDPFLIRRSGGEYFENCVYEKKISPALDIEELSLLGFSIDEEIERLACAYRSPTEDEANGVDAAEVFRQAMELSDNTGSVAERIDDESLLRNLKYFVMCGAKISQERFMNLINYLFDYYSDEDLESRLRRIIQSRAAVDWDLWVKLSDIRRLIQVASILVNECHVHAEYLLDECESATEAIEMLCSLHGKDARDESVVDHIFYLKDRGIDISGPMIAHNFPIIAIRNYKRLWEAGIEVDIMEIADNISGRQFIENYTYFKEVWPSILEGTVKDQ